MSANPIQNEKRATVVHMTSVHPPYDTRIFYRELRSLVQAGFAVTLIVPHDQDEEQNCIQIKALSRWSSRLQRMLYTVPSVLFAALRERADLYHFHDPELIPVGFILRMLGRRVVYDVHEHVPRQILTKPWIPRLFRQIASLGVDLLERLGGRIFSGIVAAWPAIERRFPSSKTVIVQNFPAKDELVVSTAIPYRERAPVVVYVGGITRIRGIREMIEAMRLVTERTNARLALAGRFSPESLQEEVQPSRHPYVEYLGWQSRDEVAALLGRARIGLVLFHPVPNHVEARPNKLFEYMSAGLPVIASDFPSWREIVEPVGCGLLVDPMDPATIADAIIYLLEHEDEAEEMGKRGRQAVEEKYNWETQAENLLSLYSQLLTRS